MGLTQAGGRSEDGASWSAWARWVEGPVRLLYINSL